MTIDVTEGFESGTFGTTLSTSNTSLTFVGAVSGSPTFDTVGVNSGSLAMKVLASAGSPHVRQDFTARGTTYLRFYLYFTALPAANVFPCAALSSGTIRAQFRLNSAGTVSLRNGTTAVYTSATTLSTSTLYRVEWDLINGTGQTVRIFEGNSTTAIIDSGTQTYNTGTHNQVTLGYATAATHTAWFDDLQIRDDVTPGPTSTDWTQSPSDNAVPTDSLTVSLGLARTLEDSGGVSDSVTVSRETSLSPADDAGTTDAAVLGLGLGRSTEDAAGSSDSLVLDRTQVLADDAVPTDATTVALGLVRSVEDAAGSSDFLATARGLAAADDAGATDSVQVSKSGSAELTLADDAGMTDAVVLGLGLGLEDGAGSSDFLVRGASQEDSAGLSDAVAMSRSAVLEDPAGLSDAIAISRTLSVQDEGGVSDATAEHVAREISDDAGAADATAVALERALVDSAGASDSLDIVLDVVVEIVDDAGCVDEQQAIGEWHLTIVDAAGVTDIVGVTNGQFRNIDLVAVLAAQDRVVALLAASGRVAAALAAQGAIVAALAAPGRVSVTTGPQRILADLEAQ